MSYQEKLIKMADTFNLNIIEEFKEEEWAIMKDMKFTSIFKKKDYKAHMLVVRERKKQAVQLDTRGMNVPESDIKGTNMVVAVEQAIRGFVNLCDAYIQLLTLLQDKAEGTKVTYKKYKDSHAKLVKYRNAMNDGLRDLSIAYADFTDDGDEDEGASAIDIVGVINYDDLVLSDKYEEKQ